jgi:hypothetical protein
MLPSQGAFAVSMRQRLVTLSRCQRLKHGGGVMLAGCSMLQGMLPHVLSVVWQLGALKSQQLVA